MSPKVHVTKWRVVLLKKDNYVNKMAFFLLTFGWFLSGEFVLSPKVHVTKWRVVFLKNDNYVNKGVVCSTKTMASQSHINHRKLNLVL